MSPPASARCAKHVETPAVDVCQRCGSFVCGECSTIRDEDLYCEACATVLERPASSRPFVAFCFAVGALPVLFSALRVMPSGVVGLVLFNQVLAWKTARSATIAQDPELVARAAPGLGFLPSKGGVFGAQYLNPRMIVRPRRWLDLKAGVVIAQTTADLVDPYHQGALGNIATYDGGDPRRHDLGLELDFGANVRVPVDTTATVQAGVEGGVLFPGHAFDDVNGGRLANQYLVNLALGIQF